MLCAERVLSSLTNEDLGAANMIAACCELSRSKAKYNTGTISVGAAAYLLAWSRFIQPRVAVEIGTFIGTSALAITAERIYTCDKDNDCLPSTETRTCYPYTTSTKMLEDLILRGLTGQVDLWFFDGRIQMEDLPLIATLSHKRTFYLFDDFIAGEKGVVNYRRLVADRQAGRHRLIRPPKSIPFSTDKTTIAVLVPHEG